MFPLKLDKCAELAFKSYAGKYLVGGERSITANGDSRGSSETFVVERVKQKDPFSAVNTRVAFKTIHNAYIFAKKDGTVTVFSKNSTPSWGLFELEQVSENKYRLLGPHNMYLVANENGDVAADSKIKGDWETWTTECVTKRKLLYLIPPSLII